MNAKTQEKITTLGVVCNQCGQVIEDEELLEDISCMRWKCPFCGAKHLSLNDERARSIIIESGGEDEPEQEEDHSVEITMLDPKELQRRHEEFLKRQTL
jgi:hypothetical protein